MIDLGLQKLWNAIHLEPDGNIWWGRSPILDNGMITGEHGMWVNSILTGMSGDYRHTLVTVYYRYGDPLAQEKQIQATIDWILHNRTPCNIDLRDDLPCLLTDVQVSTPTGMQLEAVDSEGLWVKNLSFPADYRLESVSERTE